MFVFVLVLVFASLFILTDFALFQIPGLMDFGLVYY